MTVSPLLAGLAPALWTRRDLEAGYARALAELEAERDRATVAMTTAAEAIAARQILAERIRVAADYVLTVPDDIAIDELRRDLRALLAGGMR